MTSKQYLSWLRIRVSNMNGAIESAMLKPSEAKARAFAERVRKISREADARIRTVNDKKP